MNKLIPITLSKDYVPSWGWWEGLRELLQNNLDAGSEDVIVTRYSENYTLTMTSTSGEISIQNLLLGSGNKSEDSDSIGGHGEGLKVALLVLLRCGAEVTILNGEGVVWKPIFHKSESFEEEHLHIHVLTEQGCGIKNCVTIEVKNIPKEVVEEIETKYLYLDGKPSNIYENERGEILLDEKFKGMIFVNGLFVSDLKSLRYGYNFKPSYLSLDRDRRQVESFDVKWQTKEMWNDVSKGSEEEASDIATHIHKGVKDVEYTHHTCISKPLEKACFDLYKEKYNGKVLVDRHEDVKKKKAEGFTEVEFLGNDAFTKIVRNSEQYKKINFKKEDIKTLDIILEEFKDKWYDEFSTECLDDLDVIIASISVK